MILHIVMYSTVQLTGIYRAFIAIDENASMGQFVFHSLHFLIYIKGRYYDRKRTYK